MNMNKAQAIVLAMGLVTITLSGCSESDPKLVAKQMAYQKCQEIVRERFRGLGMLPNVSEYGAKLVAENPPTKGYLYVFPVTAGRQEWPCSVGIENGAVIMSELK